MSRRSELPAASTAVILAGCGVLLTAIPHSAAAQTAIMDHTRKYTNISIPGAPDPNDVADLQFDATFSGGPGTAVEEYIGAQTITLAGVGVPTGPFDGYCVDLPGVIGAPGDTYPVTLLPATDLFTGNPSVSGAIRGAGVAWLYDNSVVTSDTDSAALQLAIWKAEYDWTGTSFAAIAPGSSLDLTAGNIRFVGMPFASTAVMNTIISQADTYLLAWGGQTDANAVLLHTTATTGGKPRQDVLINFSAPEPGSLALASALLPGLCGCGLLARRRRSGRL